MFTHLLLKTALGFVSVLLIVFGVVLFIVAAAFVHDGRSAEAAMWATTGVAMITFSLFILGLLFSASPTKRNINSLFLAAVLWILIGIAGGIATLSATLATGVIDAGGSFVEMLIFSQGILLLWYLVHAHPPVAPVRHRERKRKTPPSR